MTKAKKILIMMVIITVFASLFAGCAVNKQSAGNVDATQNTGESSNEEWQKPTPGSGGIPLPIFKNTVEYEYMLREHESFPFKDTFLQVPELEKRTNVKLKLLINPGSKYSDKVNVTLASNSLPDIIGDIPVNTANTYGPKGMFLNVWDYIDYMPNLKSIIEELPDIKQYMVNSKEMYVLPLHVNPEAARKLYFMIRTDILEKHNLKIPTTYDELYNVLKELRKLYPDIYPWVMRGGLKQIIAALSPSWNVPVDITSDGYKSFNRETKKWEFVLEKEEFRSMIEFLAKCYEEQLLDKEFLFMTLKQWEEKIIGEKGFFTIDWYNRTDWATTTAQQSVNKDYRMEAFLPPGDKGPAVMFNNGLVKSFLTVKKDVKNPRELMQFLDYMYYSKDGAILANIGLEGVTFKMVDENAWDYVPDPELKTLSASEFRAKYGTGTDLMCGISIEYYGLRQYMETEDQMTRELNMYLGHTISPNPYVQLSKDEEDILKEINEPVKTYIDQELSKMIMGERSIKEWDNLVNEANKIGAGKIIEIYNAAQERMK